MNVPPVANDCHIRKKAGYLRAEVGPGLDAEQVAECYRALATVALEGKLSRVLVLGLGTDHPHSHLAARDALIALHVIGVPAGFRIALVALTAATLNGYRHAEIEARARGLQAKVFQTEAQALRWLTAPDLH